MRNLDVWGLSLKQFDYLSSDKYKVCRGHDENSPEIGAIYVCTSNLIVTCNDENGEVQWEKDLSGITSPENTLVNISFLSLQHIVSVGLGNGELYSIFDDGQTCKLTGHIIAGLLVRKLLFLVLCRTKMLYIVLQTKHFRLWNGVQSKNF